MAKRRRILELPQLAKRLGGLVGKIWLKCRTKKERSAEIRYRLDRVQEEVAEFKRAAQSESAWKLCQEAADIVYQILIVLMLRNATFALFRKALVQQLRQKRPHRHGNGD